MNIRPEWTMLEEIDFARLLKLNLETSAGEDIDNYGFLYYYDRSYDKAPVKSTERKLNVVDRAAYNVTTSSDPIIQELAEKDEATIFATDNILSMLMCAPRSVYSWDLVITRSGNKIYLDKRDGSSLDMVSVNENAADAPLEASEGNKDSINFPNALALEATFINHNFANQTVMESDTSKLDMSHENPFYNPSDETEPLASKAYKYRRFDLSLEKDEDPLHLIVRTEIDAVVKNNISGEDQMLTLKALNEFDHKAQGSGGALDWRTKLTSQRGAVVATEMKNNSCKLARWATQAILARADAMKLGCVPSSPPSPPPRALHFSLPLSSCPDVIQDKPADAPTPLSQVRLSPHPQTPRPPRHPRRRRLRPPQIRRADESELGQWLGDRAHDCGYGPRDERWEVRAGQGPEQESVETVRGACGHV